VDLGLCGMIWKLDVGWFLCPPNVALVLPFFAACFFSCPLLMTAQIKREK
jgi:hypothetical protein